MTPAAPSFPAGDAPVLEGDDDGPLLSAAGDFPLLSAAGDAPLLSVDGNAPLFGVAGDAPLFMLAPATDAVSEPGGGGDFRIPCFEPPAEGGDLTDPAPGVPGGGDVGPAPGEGVFIGGVGPAPGGVLPAPGGGVVGFILILGFCVKSLDLNQN